MPTDVKAPLNTAEQAKFDADMKAHGEKLMREARPEPPAPDGFAHWPKVPPSGGAAADIFSPHFPSEAQRAHAPVKGSESLAEAIARARTQAA